MPKFTDEEIKNLMQRGSALRCKSCGAPVDELATFPGGICLGCHEVKFDAEVALNGGRLPRPDFGNL